MPIRDILLTLTIFGLLPVCLARPWVGVLVWSWISYMNPHRLTWGFAFDMPFALLVAVCTLLGFLFARERKPFVWTRESVLLLALWAWFTFTTLYAMYPESAWDKWENVSKSFLMALIAVPLFQDRQRLRTLVLVVAVSLGYYGMKGGVFALITGGQWMVLGPPASFFEANTETALVLNMSLPFSFFLSKDEPRQWIRWFWRAVFALTIVAVLCTYSRGGVVGLVVVLAVLFLSARGRVLMLAGALAGLALVSWWAPEQLVERIGTIRNYEEDGSAQLRFMSWRLGWELARDRPLGGGFQAFRHRETYDIYVPEYPRPFGHDAHSIYFNLLGEHGWIGLGLFGLLVISALSSLQGLRRTALRRPDLAWMGRYAKMIQASLFAYLANGATLSAAYFDLGYQLFVFVIILKGMARQAEAEPAVDGPPTAEVVPVALRVPGPVRKRELR
jgi:probable O-glycosylation ligase (exosortase A-associated)